MTSAVFCHDLNVFKMASVPTVLVTVQRVMSSMAVVMVIMSMVMLVLVTSPSSSTAAMMMTVSFYVTLFGIGEAVANAGRSRSRIDCSTTYWSGGLSSVRR